MTSDRTADSRRRRSAAAPAKAPGLQNARAVLNLPNALTLLRIFLVPLLVVVLLTRMPAKEYLALAVFLVAALTDLLDGWIARKWKKVTRLGMLLDPIADKILVSAALISLVDLQEADAWAVCIIVGREFAVSGLRSIAAGEQITIAASNLGKWKMGAQVVGISLMILGAQARRHRPLEDDGARRALRHDGRWRSSRASTTSGSTCRPSSRRKRARSRTPRPTRAAARPRSQGGDRQPVGRRRQIPRAIGRPSFSYFLS